ncbi:deoxyribonuclease [Helicobacter sp. MIT 11-5569]|uniref:endonuclease n=1 Tax=Helicobacter sp. MIT 11-5569 TaxID=1548151 RepID=UPI00051FC2F5|nr:endonuclease [Helicobacter sp. MIT 11-5569]TLD83973.1 deoxyribonuclease [Helicobacter sp. MIT 11-5569]
MHKIFLILAFLVSFAIADSFAESKRILTKFYTENPQFAKDFYCNAPFKNVNGKLEIIPSKAYTPRNAKTKKGNINKRARFIEFEHIMPAHHFGKHLNCWRKGGRKACARDSKFQKMEADMRNLVPAIGEINGDRANYRYAQAPKGLQFTQYGNCKVYVDFKNKRFYPADYSKGRIARTYLYMSEKYNIRLSKQERKLMEAWDKKYPMREEERSLESLGSTR